MKDLWMASIMIFVLGIIFLFSGCATIQPPVTQSIGFSGQSSARLFNYVAQRLATSGKYEIKSKDEELGILQVFRPMTGMFARPGYGHKVVITIRDGNVTVKAFSMEGVTGGESPEQIKDEVINIIQ